MKYFDVPEKDQNEFEKYKNIRGEQLYEFIAKYCCEFLETKKVDYQLTKEIIKYDKRIKNTLYTFLGSFEDWLKTLIYSKTIYKNKKFEVIKPLTEKEYFSSFNEINSEKYLLNDLIKIVKKHNLLDKFDYNILNRINDLRNHVMHFNFLLFSYDKNGNFFNLDDLKKQILLLKTTLPETYGKSLIKKLNEDKNKVNQSIKETYNKFFLEDLK